MSMTNTDKVLLLRQFTAYIRAASQSLICASSAIAPYEAMRQTQEELNMVIGDLLVCVNLTNEAIADALNDHD
jgi:hypothetical protein